MVQLSGQLIKTISDLRPTLILQTSKESGSSKSSVHQATTVTARAYTKEMAMTPAQQSSIIADVHCRWKPTPPTPLRRRSPDATHSITGFTLGDGTGGCIVTARSK